MIKILDKPNHFLGKSFTLSGAIEALADPLLVIAVLAVCMMGFNHAFERHYMVLGIIAFSISFPGNVGLHETPRRMARKVLTNWLVFLGILGSLAW